VVEVEGIALAEVQGKLTTFGAEPEPILSSEHIDVRLFLSRRNGRAANPSKTGRIRATGCTRHDAALVVGRNHHLSSTRRIRQHLYLGVLPEKCEIRLEGTCRRRCGRRLRGVRAAANR
jgi:hypothetical protein